MDATCPTMLNSCDDFAGFDTPNNYMTLYYDYCRDTFTPGQIERMQYAWEYFRAQGGADACCAININEDGTGKSKGKSKSKGKRGNRRGMQRRSLVRGERDLCHGCKSNFGLYRVVTQETSNDVPDCDGVEAYGNVAWFEFEGLGECACVKVGSTDVFIAISAFEAVNGDCENLQCQEATESPVPAPNGNSLLCFDISDDETYKIAVTSQQVAAITVVISPCDQATDDYTLVSSVYDAVPNGEKSGRWIPW